MITTFMGVSSERAPDPLSNKAIFYLAHEASRLRVESRDPIRKTDVPAIPYVCDRSSRAEGISQAQGNVVCSANDGLSRTAVTSWRWRR